MAVDGAPGAVWVYQGRARVVFDFVIRGGKIVRIDMPGDPDRLDQLDVQFSLCGLPGMDE